MRRSTIYRTPKKVPKEFVTSQIDAIRSGRAGRPSGRPEPTMPRVVRHVGDMTQGAATIMRRNEPGLRTVRMVGSVSEHVGKSTILKAVSKAAGKYGKR